VWQGHRSVFTKWRFGNDSERIRGGVRRSKVLFFFVNIGGRFFLFLNHRFVQIIDKVFSISRLINVVVVVVKKVIYVEFAAIIFVVIAA